MAAPNDTRILTEQELEEYVKDYHMLEDLSHYDFSNLDFDSDYFRSLPPAEQYSILNAARLRSRLRMGYTKEQLDDMFPDRLAFSRFQIQRLKERNDYTQRLMNINGMNDVGPQRIAGEKGREYFLVRNESGEGGWVLGLAAAKGGEKDKPVVLDIEQKSVEEDDAGEFEDVPLEVSQEEPEILRVVPSVRREQRTGYGVQRKLPFKAVKKREEALFVEDVEEFEDVEIPLLGEDDDSELQAAIQMSMEQPSVRTNLDVEPDRISLSDTDTDAPDLDRAIAKSLAKSYDRPMSSSSNDFDIQKALAISQEDFGPDMSSEDDDVMNVESPPAKDKGKGKEIPTPEATSEDEQLQKAIELSKSETRFVPQLDGIGSSSGIVMESPSKPTLGKSMFRKKAQPPTTVEKKVDGAVEELAKDKVVPLEIREEPAMDLTLEKKVREPSPVEVPIVSSPVQPSLKSPAVSIEKESLSPQSASHVQEETLQTTPSPSPDILSPSPQPQPSTQDVSVSHRSAFEPTQSSQEDHLYLSDDEDEELMAQLAAEEEEHARFASQLNPNGRSTYSALQDHLDEESFEKEMRSLRNQQKKDRRDADEVNQIMVLECQQLLRLFGLPYITAPMEAEAQCAELVRLGLVDGIVTDDSDIFLFGGTRVYKNMFNQGKFVECYLLSDLERDFNLDRPKFINLAHLLGSDYAEGIPHVGPVNALELLSEFPGDKGLEEFREWWIAVQQGRAPKDSGEGEFRKKFRKNSTKIFLPNDFPNRVVDNAYLHPEVDHDPQQFIWGVPDLDALRSFLMSQIGWSKERTDEILVPVIKDMNRRQVLSHRI
jgi:DNA excision repair protein ERCC-5